MHGSCLGQGTFRTLHETQDGLALDTFGVPGHGSHAAMPRLPYARMTQSTAPVPTAASSNIGVRGWPTGIQLCSSDRCDVEGNKRTALSSAGRKWHRKEAASSRRAARSSSCFTSAGSSAEQWTTGAGMGTWFEGSIEQALLHVDLRQPRASWISLCTQKPMPDN